MYILAECHGDTMLSKMVLVAALQLQNSDVDRSCNIGEVSRRFKEYYKNRKAVGIIDKAKNIGKTFKGFKTYPNHNLDNMIHLWDEQSHHLIYFKNGLEEFINESADQSGINRSNHPKFTSVQQLIEIIKDINIEKDGSFRNFLADVKNGNPANFRTLIKWVNIIRNL